MRSEAVQWTDTMDRRALAMERDGYSTKDIGEALGLTQTVVQRRMLALLGPRRGSTFIWSPEREEALRKGFALGKSASEMGREFGISRNAVIGKLHRIGLTRQPGPEKFRNETSKGVGKRPVGRPPKPKPAPVVEKAAPEPPRAAWAWTPSQAGKYRPAVLKPLEALTSHCCRWPCGEVGAPDFGFCGEPRREGQTYCDIHREAAFTRPATAEEKRAAKKQLERLAARG